MKQELVRFGIAMEPRLVEQLDQVAADRGCTRSEVIRDLSRAEVVKGLVQNRVPAVAAITLVYNHHVRELSERLTAIQHDLGERVVSTMHVHLDHDHCLEVIVMRGRSDELKGAADRLQGTRGVTHGGFEIIAESVLAETQTTPHAHHGHGHAHSEARVAKKKRARGTR
jgi:CopG family nickel-responsive transcriptional regulator